MTIKIGIVGYKGYVGSAMDAFFRRRADLDVCGYDSAGLIPGSALDTRYRDKINRCAIGVVCVPTPESEDGSCDTSIVESVVEWLETPIILIKSTVPPGTCERLADETCKTIVFSPEYIGESSYWSNNGFEREVAATPFFIFGHTGDSSSTEAAYAIADLYATIAGPQKSYHVTRADVAEAVKLFENSYYAAKVTFMNEMRRICDAMGLPYHDVRTLWLQDPRINPMHTLAFAGAPGYAGKCYPKDIANLTSCARAAGYDPVFLSSVQECNAVYRGEVT